MTRTLVIGAGHNGLMAAIHLAAHGLDVTVLEHAPRPGGASTSEACTLPGFVHDHCAGFLPMTVASPAMRELQLERDGLEWINPAVVLTHPFADGSAIALHRDVAETVASLGAAGAGWAAAMQRLLPLATPLVEAVLSPLPPLRAPARLALGLRGEGLEWARRLAGSAEALGLDLFEGDRRATAWLAGSAQHSGLPPTAAASGAFGLLLQLIGHSHGWPLPRGGVQSLADALVRRAVREGATIRCDATVEQVLIRRGHIAGVRLAGGDELPADAVVSTVSAGVLARLIPAGALPGRLHRRLRIWRYGTAPFKLDYALSGPVPWTAAEARQSAVVHVAGELENLTRAADDGRRGDVPERPALVVGQQSLHDPRAHRQDTTPSTSTVTSPRATNSRTRRWPTASKANSSASHPASAISYSLGRSALHGRPSNRTRALSAAIWPGAPTSSTNSSSSDRRRSSAATAAHSEASTSPARRRIPAAPCTA